MIFIAAHGTKDINRPDQYYILAHDTYASDIPGTGYPMTEVECLEDKTVIDDVVALKVPGLDAERHLVIMHVEEGQQAT